MKQSQDQIQTLQVLYELAMSIGTSLNLRQMLKVSLLAFMKKMNCVVGGVYQYHMADDSFHFEAALTIPRHTNRNQTFQEALAQLPDAPDAQHMSRFLGALPLVGECEDGNYYHLLELPGFGVMVLIKNKEAIDPMQLKSLRPLQEKLAAAAIACLSESALRTAQEQSQTILESITTPLLISKLSDGKIIFANQLLADMIGVPLEELIGNITPDFYADAAERQTLLTNLQAQGALSNYELRLKRGNGELIWALISIRPFTYQGERALITSLIDITERKQTMLALEELQARNQLILESVTLPLLISRVEDGVVLFANERLVEMMGMQSEDVLGKQTPDFYHEPTDRLEILKNVREHGGNDNKELPIMREGEILWVLLSNRLVQYEGVPAIITTLIDITDRKRAEEALARRAAELETVSRVSAHTATIRETDKLLQELVDLTKERFNLYHAHIYLLNAQKTALILTSGAGAVGQEMVAAGHAIPLHQEQSLVARAARNGQGVTENDVSKNPAFLPNPLLPETRSEMAVPMIVGDQIVGVLDVQSNEVGRFTQQDIAIQTTLSAQAAVALQNANQYQATQRALSETEALLEITRISSSLLDMEAMLAEVLDRVLEITRFEIGLISIADPERNTLQIAAHRLPEVLVQGIQRNGLDGSLCDLVYRRQKPMVVENLAADSPIDAKSMVAMGYKSYQGVPLEVKGEVLGTLCIFSNALMTSKEKDINLLQAVGQQIGFALRNATLFEQTQTALEEVQQRETQLNELTRRLTREGWQEYLSAAPTETASFVFDPTHITRMNQLTGAVTEATAVETAVNGASADQSLKLPIQVHGETIGELAVEPDEADEEEMTDLITAVAEQLSARIENLRLTDQTQMALAEAERQSEELALINRVVTKVAASLNLQESLEIVAAELAQAISVEQVAITLLNEARTEATVVAEYFGESDYEKAIGVVFTLADNPLTRQVIESRQPVIVSDAQHNPLTAPIHDVMRARGTQTLIILPMTAGNEVIGTVGIDILDEKQTLHETELRLAETLIFQAATAVQNAKLFDQTEAALAETEALYKVSSELNEAGDYDSVTRILRQHTIAANCHIVSLSLFDRPYTETQTPEWIEIASDWSAEPIPQGRTLRHKFADYTWPPANQMIKQPEMVVTQDIADSSDLDEKLKDSYLKSKTHSALVLPLVVGSQWIGYINMLFPQKVNLAASDRNLLTALGRQAAVVVQSIGLLSATRKRAQREHQLREIAEKVRGSADVETIMRTAVAEVGRALGRRTYISLEESAADTDSIA